MNLHFLAGVIYKGKIYYSIMNGNGLFEYNPETNLNKFICVFEKERISYILHVQAVLFENEMWLIPQEGEYIVCVNLDTFEKRYYSVPLRSDFEKKHAFYTVIKYKNKVYLLPNEICNIVEIDLTTKQCVAFFGAEYFTRICARGGFIKNGYMTILRNDGQKGLIIQLKDKKVIYEDMVSETLKYHYYFAEKDDCFMMPVSGEGIQLFKIGNNGELNYFREINVGRGEYFRGNCYCKYVVFYPYNNSRDFLVYDRKNEKVDALNGLLGDGKPCRYPFEVNTIDSDMGFWVTANNGVFMDLSDINNIKRYNAIASTEICEVLRQEYEKYGLLNKYLSNKILIESAGLVELGGFLKHVLSS